MKRRVNALKNLQVKCAHIEAKFYEEVHELERKYAALYQPLFDKVSRIKTWSTFIWRSLTSVVVFKEDQKDCLHSVLKQCTAMCSRLDIIIGNWCKVILKLKLAVEQLAIVG